MAKNEQVIVAQYQAQYRGPIPSASEMAHYKQVDPTLPDRIMSLAEQQSAHRQELENKHLDAASKRSLLGMLFAFVIVMVAIVGGIWCIIVGKEASGISAILGAVLPVAGLFVYSTVSARKERQQKRDEVKKGKIS